MRRDLARGMQGRRKDTTVSENRDRYVRRERRRKSIYNVAVETESRRLVATATWGLQRRGRMEAELVKEDGWPLPVHSFFIFIRYYQSTTAPGWHDIRPRVYILCGLIPRVMHPTHAREEGGQAGCTRRRPVNVICERTELYLHRGARASGIAWAETKAGMIS